MCGRKTLSNLTLRMWGSFSSTFMAERELNSDAKANKFWIPWVLGYLAAYIRRKRPDLLSRARRCCFRDDFEFGVSNDLGSREFQFLTLVRSRILETYIRPVPMDMPRRESYAFIVAGENRFAQYSVTYDIDQRHSNTGIVRLKGECLGRTL